MTYILPHMIGKAYRNNIINVPIKFYEHNEKKIIRSPLAMN